MTTRDPTLNPVPVAELRPTQMTVGYREVEAKRMPGAHTTRRTKANPAST